MGIRGKTLLGKKDEARESGRRRRGVHMDVESGQALEELCTVVRVVGVEFVGLPFPVPQHVISDELSQIVFA